MHVELRGPVAQVRDRPVLVGAGAATFRRDLLAAVARGGVRDARRLLLVVTTRVPRPQGVPGPPGDLERALLDDGTITDRCGYHDGTLHVVTDDVHLATRLLAPLHGDRRRVERAVFPFAARQAARIALRTALSLDVVCAWGSAPYDDARPTETVHSLEVGWITKELAAALAPVPDGLVRVRTHVTVSPRSAP